MDVERHRWRCSWGEFLDLLGSDRATRERLTSAIAAAPFDAVFWETTPVRRASLDDPFEFVIADARALAGVRAERRAFREHFERAGPDAVVTSFANIGGDADLVVPTPLTHDAVYAHLAAFVRGAPAHQIDATWQAVADAARHRLDAATDPIWVSTSGLGVFWVHIRIDSRPKYYTHQPYRTPPPVP